MKHKHLRLVFDSRPGTEAGADLVPVYGPEPLVRVLVRPQLQVHACGRDPSQCCKPVCKWAAGRAARPGGCCSNLGCLDRSRGRGVSLTVQICDLRRTLAARSGASDRRHTVAVKEILQPGSWRSGVLPSQTDLRHSREESRQQNLIPPETLPDWAPTRPMPPPPPLTQRSQPQWKLFGSK